MVAEGFLTAEQMEMVNCHQIADFFATDLGKRLASAKQVLREFKFSILDDGTHYDPKLTQERILLQGVVDCAIVEEDGITVIDFKTDSVSDGKLAVTAEKYRLQVSTYAEALAKIFQKPIKEAVLYFFSTGTLFSVM